MGPAEFRAAACGTFGERIVRLCEAVLADGRLSEHERADTYRALIGCEMGDGEYVAKLRTSCGIFVRGIWHWCGRSAKRGARAGWPMFGGWLGDVSMRHRAWIRADAGIKPKSGDVFFVQSSGNPNNVHVGIFLEELSPDVWRTAEGGGAPDGSGCDFSERTLGPGFDRWGRVLRGWFAAELLDPVRDTLPTPRETPAPGELPRILRRGMIGTDVRKVQGIVGATPDGSFGSKTEAAVKAWQSKHGLTPDGIVGPITWSAMI